MTDKITRHRWTNLDSETGERRCKKCNVKSRRATGWLVDHGDGYVFYDPMPVCTRNLYSATPDPATTDMVDRCIEGEERKVEATDLSSGHDAKKDSGRFEDWDPRESDIKGYGENP